MRKPHKGRPWYRIEYAADEEDATVWIYDAIVDGDGYFGGVPAESFVKELNALDAETIHLRINSPGGSVFPAMAIYTALRNHPARVVAHIDGLAASAASFVALAADEVRMTKGAFYMIHNGHVFAIGDKRRLRETADLLEKVDGQILDIYAGRTDKDADEVTAWMDAETWFTAEEAKEAGFVDEIDHAEPMKASFDLSVFNRVPEPLAGQEPRREARKIESERDLEALLRDEGGLSHAAAKKIAAGGYKALSGPRDEDGTGGTPPEAEAHDVAALDELNAAILNARLTLRRAA